MHDLLLAVVRVVSVEERDAAPFETDNARVGDGNAMRIGAEVGQHALGSGEGGFGVDDPVDLSQGTAERGYRGVVPEFSALESLLKSFEELRAKHL